MGKNKLYANLARWMPLLTPKEHYLQEASIFRRLFLLHDPNISSILELGCGAGNNAYYLKRRFIMTLVDLSNDMLALSKAQNPECRHFQGDMRSVRLEEEFDGLFIHDAIGYMTDLNDLEKVFQTAYVHCKPKGQVIIAPDFFEETFQPRTSSGGTDKGDSGMRYLEWIRDPVPTDKKYTTEFAFLLNDSGTISTESDTHEMGLFSQSEWLQGLSKAGFKGEIIREQFNDEGYSCLDIIVARKD